MTSNFPDFYKSNQLTDRSSTGKCTMKTMPEYISIALLEPSDKKNPKAALGVLEIVYIGVFVRYTHSKYFLRVSCIHTYF